MKNKILVIAIMCWIGQIDTFAQDDMYLGSSLDTSPRVSTTDSVKSNLLPLTATGAYEVQEVVSVESASAALLFERAMIALVEWTGPDGKAKTGIDYQSHETHTVIYKGTFSLGFKNTFLGDGWNRYAEFSLKVRCKDGRAQVTTTVSTVKAIYNRGGATTINTVAQVVDAVNKSKGNKRERGEQLLDDIKTVTDMLHKAMILRLSQPDDDGF